jgi:hypothetical protein
MVRHFQSCRCCIPRLLHGGTAQQQFEHQGGQHSQDIFLFQNLYKYWPMTGRKGFYVESGANDAL